MPQFKVEIVVECEADSAADALYDAIDRFVNEETVARVTQLSTGEEVWIECQSGEIVDFSNPN